MAFSKRNGLNLVAQTGDFIDHQSYDQNTNLRLSILPALSGYLGSEGVYASIATAVVALGSSVPPLNVMIEDTYSNSWTGSTDVKHRYRIH